MQYCFWETILNVIAFFITLIVPIQFHTVKSENAHDQKTWPCPITWKSNSVYAFHAFTVFLSKLYSSNVKAQMPSSLPNYCFLSEMSIFYTIIHGDKVVKTQFNFSLELLKYIWFPLNIILINILINTVSIPQ